MATAEKVDILIVGFGFSCIPLLRELDKDNIAYSIVSDINPVWKELQKNNRLDFDLVSSYYTSFYSFDLVNDIQTDRYTTAKEYYNMHLRYLKKYENKIIYDHVDRIENYAEYSLVYTQSGRLFQANNVILSVGFKRKILNALATFDYRINNKTVVFTTMGDSANLMIAKLIPRGNKIIVVSNGFLLLEKINELSGATYTVDQLEFHNISYFSRKIYRDLYSGTFWRSAAASLLLIQDTFLFRYLFGLIFLVAKIFTPHLFEIKHPKSIPSRKRSLVNLSSRLKIVPVPNTLIAIKHWPIDKYAKDFANNMEHAIQEGYLLNDTAFFIDQHLIELYRKPDVIINEQQKTLQYKDQIINYDYLVEGDIEQPRLPKIIIHHKKDPNIYHYQYRDNYLGVIPKNLKNIFLVGYTRPTSGGLANITEMQGLFIHKCLTDPAYKNDLYENLESKLEKYNARHYLAKENGPCDHLVYYGTFTEDVAREIGINLHLKDCRSLKDLIKYFIFPNNAFKYRQTGRYKVDGCDKLCDYIYNKHNGFSVLLFYLGRYIEYHLLIFSFFLKLYLENTISLPIFISLLVLQYIFSFIVLIPTSLFSENGYVDLFRCVYLFLGILLVLIFGAKLFLPIIIIDFVSLFLMRLFKPVWAKYILRDLKIKSRYGDFFKKYLSTYNKVNP